MKQFLIYIDQWGNFNQEPPLIERKCRDQNAPRTVIAVVSYLAVER